MNYTSNNFKKILFFILLIATILRIGWLWRGDPVNDEVLMAFRAVGPIDFDEAEVQTTPLEWFDPGAKVAPNILDAYRIGTGAPWWVFLSTHDQPPLVYWVQYFFMKVFGEHAWAFRLPSVILGVASVYLVYLIGKNIDQITSPNPSFARRGKQEELTGLLAALLYAVTLNAVYISRTGMQEPYVIFFILWMMYALLRARGHRRFYIWAGVALGLGILSKYTALFWGAPLAIAWIFLRDRGAFRTKHFWIGLAVVLLCASPMIIYNIELYRAVGHFDFQFSYIFRQAHLAWQVEPGKDIGTLSDRLHDFIPRLIATNSWVFLSLFFVSVTGFLWALARNFKATLFHYGILLYSFFFLLLLLLAIGPAYRFLTMLTPFMALSVGVFFSIFFMESQSSSRAGFEPEAGMVLPRAESVGLIPERAVLGRARKARGLLWLVILFEIFYSWNNQIAFYPVGPTPWFSSKVRYENYNWGYNELGAYFEGEFANKVPAITFDVRYDFLEKLRQSALDEGIQNGYTPYPVLVVSFGNFDKAGKLWALDRLHIYHAWPIISLKDYYDYLQKNGADFYTRSGFKNFYFVIPTNSVPSSEFSQLITGLTPLEIKNPRGDIAFLVYRR